MKADFTDNVSAFIELESYEVWGEDFRSAYVTSADMRAASVDDVEIYQAYIEVEELFGHPLRLRIGRQEMDFGDSWLIGHRDPWEFGLSFDAIRLTYAEGPLTVDAWWSKLTETGGAEKDGDVDFYGVYGTYAAMEHLSVDAYWFWVRDARSVNDTLGTPVAEAVEFVFGLDDYEKTNFHTIGLRLYGDAGNFDYDAYLAYQFGEADQVGSLFAPIGGTYGDQNAEYDNWGMDVELGYSFNTAWQPRVYIGGAWFQGEDNRGGGLFGRREASVSFNRLFSTWPYFEWYANRQLSNILFARTGVSVSPMDKVDLLLSLVYAETDEAFEAPIGPLGIFTKETDDYIGTEVRIYATYHYSEDLDFQVRWAHLFTGDGLTGGQFVAANGLGFSGGSGNDDVDYLEFSMKLTF